MQSFCYIDVYLGTLLGIWIFRPTARSAAIWEKKWLIDRNYGFSFESGTAQEW